MVPEFLQVSVSLCMTHRFCLLLQVGRVVHTDVMLLMLESLQDWDPDFEDVKQESSVQYHAQMEVLRRNKKVRYLANQELAAVVAESLGVAGFYIFQQKDDRSELEVMVANLQILVDCLVAHDFALFVYLGCSQGWYRKYFLDQLFV